MNTNDATSAKAPMELDARGLYVVANQADEMRVAEMLLRSGAVNSTLKTVVHVAMAIQAAKSLGLNPYTALRQIGFVNGSLMLYGDLEMAIIRASGKLAEKVEFTFCVDRDGKYKKRCFENENLHMPAAGAVCRMKRTGEEGIEEASFTVEDAKAAGLWGRSGPWRQYPTRMLQVRARGLCVRNLFSDITQGAASEYDLHEQAPDVAASAMPIDGEVTGTAAALKMLRDKKNESQTPSSTVPQEDTQQ